MEAIIGFIVFGIIFILLIFVALKLYIYSDGYDNAQNIKKNSLIQEFISNVNQLCSHYNIQSPQNEFYHLIVKINNITYCY